MIGMIACAGGKELVLSGDGLDTCTLASAQRVGPFDLSAGTLVVFTGGRLDKFEMSTRGMGPKGARGSLASKKCRHFRLIRGTRRAVGHLG